MSLDESRKLAQQGKAFVWIDSGIHASETAPPQHSPDLAYRMLTDESEETRRIRDKVILIQILNINPDGADWVIEWYRSNLGTPYETAPLPRLYHRYAGHDNNRDWYMLNLPETRFVTKQLCSRNGTRRLSTTSTRRRPTRRASLCRPTPSP